jgi:hypothetical protein
MLSRYLYADKVAGTGKWVIPNDPLRSALLPLQGETMPEPVRARRFDPRCGAAVTSHRAAEWATPIR